MKILLINPPMFRFIRAMGPTLPLGLGYIAAVLEQKGHHVRIYDAEWNLELYNKSLGVAQPSVHMASNWSRYLDAVRDTGHAAWGEIRTVLEEFRPEIIGVTTCSLNLASAGNVAEIAKAIDRNIVTVAGGPGATISPEELLSAGKFDFVVRGEGEMTMAELVDELQKAKPEYRGIAGLVFRDGGNPVRNPERPLLENLEALPYPARHLFLGLDKVPQEIRAEAIFGGIVTSRGCPSNCAFCANRNVWLSRKVRLRPAQDVVNEVLHLKEHGGSGNIIFWDDLFTLKRARTVDVCNLLLERKAGMKWLCLVRADTIDRELLQLMKKAGCYEVQMGVESGSNRVLKFLNKETTVELIRSTAALIRECGLRWHGFFIIGIPGETREEMTATMNLLREIQPDRAQISVFTPFPGTPLHADLLAAGKFDNQGAFGGGFLNLDRCYSGTMPLEEFRAFALACLKEMDDYNAARLSRERNSLSRPLPRLNALARRAASKILPRRIKTFLKGLARSAEGGR